MSVYLDTSVLVPLFIREAFSERALEYLRRTPPLLLVSDFAAAEFASALARRVRMNELPSDGARGAFRNFDDWAAHAATKTETLSADVATAAAFIRRLDLPLRTPDAIHIAIAQRAGATLATFDRAMATAADALGVAIEPV